MRAVRSEAARAPSDPAGCCVAELGWVGWRVDQDELAEGTEAFGREEVGALVGDGEERERKVWGGRDTVSGS